MAYSVPRVDYVGVVFILYLVVLLVVAGFATLWADWPENYAPWLRSIKQKLPPPTQLRYLLVVGILILLFLTYLDFKSVGLL
jgi:hypothetical protein